LIGADAQNDTCDIPDVDSDSDGLPDEWELQYFSDMNENGSGDPDMDNLTNATEYEMGTNPSNADTDNDGLNDGLEVNILGTDPTLTDTDTNGILDGDEDFDLDGFTNKEEVQCGSDPIDHNSICGIFLPFLMLLFD